MNNSIKAIIELIEPNMEKDLSQWCKFKLFNNDEIMDVEWYFEYEWPWDYLDDRYLFPEDVIEWHKKDDNIIEKVYWHYDITAVLKYINGCWYTSLSWYIDMEIIQFHNIWLTQIPNKPLHLYTEEEEKDLLLILNKWIKK
jgi:hypothetical protein